MGYRWFFQIPFLIAEALWGYQLYGPGNSLIAHLFSTRLVASSVFSGADFNKVMADSVFDNLLQGSILSVEKTGPEPKSSDARPPEQVLKEFVKFIQQQILEEVEIELNFEVFELATMSESESRNAYDREIYYAVYVFLSENEDYRYRLLELRFSKPGGLTYPVNLAVFHHTGESTLVEDIKGPEELFDKLGELLSQEQLRNTLTRLVELKRDLDHDESS